MSPTGHDPAFIESATRAFGFLCDLGFDVTLERTDPYSAVRWESSGGVFVEVYRIDYEDHVGFRVGTAARPKDALNEYELQLLMGKAYPEAPLEPTGSRDRLMDLAALLRQSGERALNGDPVLFEELEDLRRRYTARFT